MEDLLIHIGYHKTGTSWLQRHYFPRTDASFAYLKGPLFKHFLWDLVFTHALDFDAERFENAFAELVESESVDNKLAVLSAERLSGNPFSGGYDMKDIADRLHQVFPNAKILMVIREQRSMILSTYKEYVECGGATSIRDFVERKRDVRFPVFRLDYFKYHSLIGYYQNLFGKDKVLALPHEKFQRTPLEFLEDVSRFCGLSMAEGSPVTMRVNVAMLGLTVSVKRRINPFLVTDSTNGFSPLRIKGMWRLEKPFFTLLDRFVPEPVHRAVDRHRIEYIDRVAWGHYAESNRITSRLIGIDLAEFGYEV